MSSDIQSALEFIILNNELSLVVVTVVAYDCILNFSREVDYVWCKPWTLVSMIFVVVRYIGLCWVMIVSLIGTTFIPGPLEVSIVLNRVFIWAFLMFLSATDLVMILRVYAMWNRSRTILYILLFIWVVQVVTTAVFNGIYDNPGTHSSVRIVQIVDFSFCNDSFANFPPTLNALIIVPRLVLASTLIILAGFQTLKQSVAMYKATKQWKPNHYMQLLVGDGILYFFVNVLFQINDLINLAGIPSTNASLFLCGFAYIYFYTLIPRFIISIRELYDRDARGRVHVDTGFGVESQSLTVGLDTAVSAMVFAGGNQGAEAEGGTDHAGDLEMARRMHGSGLNEDAPPGGRD